MPFASLTYSCAAFGSKSTFVPLDPSENTFLDAMILLGKYGIHRAWLVNSPAGDITNVITQSAVLELLGNNIDSFQALAALPLSKLGLGQHKAVAAVTVANTSWDAFRLIHDNVCASVLHMMSI